MINFIHVVLAQVSSAPVVAPAVTEATSGSPFVEALLKYVIAPSLAVIGPLLVAGLAKLIQYLHLKAKESKAAYVASVFAELAQSVVAEIEITLRPQIQLAMSDGTLTKEEGEKLKAEALRILKEKAPSGLLSAASSIIGPLLDTWLGGLIERANTAMPETSVPPKP